MEIIKLGNKDRKKIFECEYCLCQFSKTAEELANLGWSTFFCPCCGKVMTTNGGTWEDGKE